MTLDRNCSKFQDNHSEKEQIFLLEEKLEIARHKQKLGEVVVSKEVSTKIVEIPIKKEILVVRRIADNQEKLMEIKLSEESINGLKYDELNHGDRLESKKSSFLSLVQNKELLEAIECLNLTGNLKIRLEFFSNCPEDNHKISETCDQYN